MIDQVAKEQSGIQVDQSWTAVSLDASMNSSKPVNNWQFYSIVQTDTSHLSISATSLESLLSTIGSVCLSVCHVPSNCFFFVSRWNRAIFWPPVFHEAVYKTLFLDF